MRSDNLRAPPHWVTPELVGRILNLAMPVGSTSAPVTAIPTRGVKPQLTIIPASPRAKPPHPPVTHSRRADEDEAAHKAPRAASPRRTKRSTAPAADTSSPRHRSTTEESGPALPPVAQDRLESFEGGRKWRDYNAERMAATAARLAADRPLFQIAYDRGISVADLARALGRPEPTVYHHAKLAGFEFGRRRRLADRLTLEQLQVLADPSVPTPEFHGDRAALERTARVARERREARAADVARRKTERAAEAQERRRVREQQRTLAREERERERLASKAKVKSQSKRICEVETGARSADPLAPAPSREPAPSSPARAQPMPERDRAIEAFGDARIASRRGQPARSRADRDARRRALRDAARSPDRPKTEPRRSLDGVTAATDCSVRRAAREERSAMADPIAAARARRLLTQRGSRRCCSSRPSHELAIASNLSSRLAAPQEA
jgi:hypothetical protein